MLDYPGRSDSYERIAMAVEAIFRGQLVLRSSEQEKL